MPKENKKLIYITAYSRSGSTLLDIILGNRADVFSSGELFRLTTSGWMNDEFCSCHTRVSKCSLWSKVKKEWEKKTGATPQEYAALQNKFERIRSYFILCKEKKHRSTDYQRYLFLTENLLQIIFSSTQTNIIVDSSKMPMRALAISNLENIDILYIQLTRDARGVCWSLNKKHKKNEEEGLEKDIKSEPIFKTALLWVLHHCITEAVIRKIKSHKIVHIKYEDVTDNPSHTVQNIWKNYQLKPQDSSMQSTHFKGPKHMVAGNRMRMHKDIVVKFDNMWKTKMPFLKKIISTFLTLPFLKKYNYL